MFPPDGAEPEEDVDMFQPGDTDVDGSDDVVSVINFDDSFVRFVMTTDEADDRPEVLCVICYEMDRFDCRPCCRGSVCDECLRHHIKTQLTDFGNVRITCPCAGCDHLVYQAEVHHMLSSADGHELLAKYERWIAAANSQGPNRKTCPRCSDITEVDSSVLNVSRLAKCGIPVRCVGCQLDWCFLCHAPMHTGITCKAFRAGDKLLKQWAIDVRDAGDRNAQRCPKCKVKVGTIE